MVQVGDWVTQYSAGFWQVVAVYPKFAENDYRGEKVNWSKGDRLGDWAVLKKGLTPKMKFSNLCECVDASWCKPVSSEQHEAILSAFEANPKAKQEFDNAPNQPQPYVSALWLDLAEEKAEELEKLLAQLPERFNDAEFRGRTAAYRQYECKGGGSHILYLFSYPWEMDGEFNMLHHGPKLQRVK